MKTRFASLLVGLLCLFGAGCVAVVDPDADLSDLDFVSDLNVPVVGAASNSFGFALMANEIALDEEYALRFTDDALSIGIAVAGYRGGSGSFELVGADGTVFYRRNLGRNVAEGTTVVDGHRPVRAVVRLDDYSGIVSIGVSLDD